MSRSYLFVPADSEAKLAKAQGATADALILDLEDSVQPKNRPLARDLVAEFLGENTRADVWIRINPLDSEDSLEDLRAVLAGAPHGIVLPKPEGAGDTVKLAKLLDVLEHENGLETGSTRILPIATERPQALFGLAEYANCSARLGGITWGAEDLSAALGAATARDALGDWLPPYQLARSLCLFAAAAAEVPAIDTVYTDFRDAEGLAASAARARRDGFVGMLAIHPAQLDVINDAFTPTTEEIARAKKIVAAFADNPDAGVLGIEGEMLDRPHLKQAERLLETAARFK